MVGLLWALLVLLLVIWFIGFVLVHIGGALIHVLLIIALIILIWNLLFAPRAV